MNKPVTLLILLALSIAINVYTIRDIIKYEPDKYKKRLYYNLREVGYFEKKLDLSELKSPNTMIALTLGQSNAGNSSNSMYEPRNKVLNYYNGSVYRAHDPLIGANGSGGSVWPLLGDKLINNGLYKKVIIVPIAVGNTSIEDWATGECHNKLVKTLDDLQNHGIKLTHIFWHQGEANNGTPKDNYKRNLSIILKTIRNHNQTAPFFCSIASYNPLISYKTLGVDSIIENAQKEFISENKGVLTGPNTDLLIYAIHRHDSWHFSAFGKEQYANLWLKAIKERKE